MAIILSLFNIQKIKGEDGQEIIPKVGTDSGFARFDTRTFFAHSSMRNDDIVSSHPKPFKCSVQLRNDKAEDLIGQIKIDLMSE